MIINKHRKTVRAFSVLSLDKAAELLEAHHKYNEDNYEYYFQMKCTESESDQELISLQIIKHTIITCSTLTNYI